MENNNGKVFLIDKTWYLIVYQFHHIYLLREISQTPLAVNNVIDCFPLGNRQWYFTGSQGISIQIGKPLPDLLADHSLLASLLTHPRTIQYLANLIIQWQQVDCPEYARESKDSFYEYFSYLTGRVPTLTGLTLTPSV